jgi:serine O-acetyltransferase
VILKKFMSDVRADYVANGKDWTLPGFRTLFVYRIGNWRMLIRSKLLRAPFSLIYRMLYRYCRNVYGIEIPYSAKIEPGVVIEHQGGIVIHGNARIGSGTIIRQNCTLGIRSLARLDEAPSVGKGVNIGAGAVLLGNIIIGDGAQIGANAVVLEDVPANALAVGVPAVIKERKALIEHAD